VPVRIGGYELLCELGSGGMATLFVARQVSAADVQRLVAVKRVHRHILAVPGVQTMFRDEARLAALVRHANVARLLDVCEVDGELLIVLDYLESVSLSGLEHAARAAGERLPIPIAVRVLADALAGLHAAHEATDLHGEPLQIVHRDFSPQNVLVGVDGMSHLIDFGVAKAAARATQTQSGMLKGKLQYMSPEQARGGSELDRRSDIFSAGTVLFEALTGRLPFGDDGDDPSAILLRIVLDPVPRASSLVAGVPEALDLVIERALERVRDERYLTASEMREALLAAVEPANDADVQAVIQRWCHEALTARRAKIQRALAESAPTLAAVASETAGTAPTALERPSPIGGAAAPQSIPKKQRLGRARVAVAGSAVMIAVAGLGSVGYGLLRDRDGTDHRQLRLDASPVTIVVAPPLSMPVDAGAVDAPPTAAVDASVARVPVDAHHTPKPVDSPKVDAGTPTTSVSSTSAGSNGHVRPGFTADGALLVRGHEVRVHLRLVSNTTATPDDAIVHYMVDHAWYELTYYKLGLSRLPADQPPPAGTVTVTYNLVNNAFVPLPQQTATFDNAQFSNALASGLMALLKPVFDGGHHDVSGRIVLTAQYDVQ
jgi:hypothetical protein